MKNSNNNEVGDIQSMKVKLWYNGIKSLSSIKTREVYWTFIYHIVKEPTAIYIFGKNFILVPILTGNIFP